MEKIILITFISMILGLAPGSYGTEVTLGPDLKIPPLRSPC